MNKSKWNNFMSGFFSVKNYQSESGVFHKVVTFFGIKFKWKHQLKTLKNNVKLLDDKSQKEVNALKNNLDSTKNEVKALSSKLKNIDNKYNRLLQCYYHGINKEKVNYEINLFDKLGVTEVKREKKLIVSLTSYPGRMYDIHFTIYSLLNQTVKPDEIVLWLVKEEFQQLPVSEKLLNFQKYGLTIKWIDKKLKPYGKLVPALESYPNDIIITADDDIYYPSNWLEVLFNEYQKEPNLIHAHRCHKVDLDKSYNHWEKDVTDASVSFSNFLTGVGGVLYPPNSLYKDVINDELFMDLSPNADDIWFWAMAVLKGTKIKICDDAITHLIYTTPEREYGLHNEQTLFSYNGGQCGNDVQLAKVLNHYPQIKEILDEPQIVSKKSKPEINVCYITDENFCLPTATSILSLIESNESNVNLFIIADNVPVSIAQYFESLSTLKVKIKIINAEVSYKDLVSEHGHVSKSALLKFELPYHLSFLDEVLYIDGDTIIKKDLKELYEADIADYYVGAISDYRAVVVKKHYKGVNTSGYFNSGVMLLNLRKMREDSVTEKLIEYKKNEIRKGFMDQDAFNVVFNNKVLYLNPKFNFMLPNLVDCDKNSIAKHYRINVGELETYLNNQEYTILHITNKLKPWNSMQSEQFEIWSKYFAKITLNSLKENCNVSEYVKIK